AIPSPMPRVPPVTSATRVMGVGGNGAYGANGTTTEQRRNGDKTVAAAPSARLCCSVSLWSCGSLRRLRDLWAEEGGIGRPLSKALHIQRRLARVVVAPLAGLAARRGGSRRHRVPPIPPVIDRMPHPPLLRSGHA